jgi:hypothetical protein
MPTISPEESAKTMSVAEGAQRPVSVLLSLKKGGAQRKDA